MFITVPRNEARRRLQACGYHLVMTMNALCEVWTHPNRSTVYLHPELDGTGAYEEEMIKAVERDA